MATRNAIIKRNNSGTIDTIHPETTWDQVKDRPSTFTATPHPHDASNITSGTLNVDRIPTLPQSKVANLQSTLNIGLNTPITELNNHTLNDVFSNNLLETTQLLSNGDFSNGTTGWLTAGGTVSNGVLSMILQDNPFLRQSFNTQPQAKIYFIMRAKKSSDGFNQPFAIRLRLNTTYATSSNNPVIADSYSNVSIIFDTTTTFNNLYMLRNSVDATHVDFDFIYLFNISILIGNQQYSPLYQTTFDLMTDEEIKLQMDQFIEKPYLFIDYQTLYLLNLNLTVEQMDYWYSVYVKLVNDYARPASDVSAWAKEATKPAYNASEITETGSYKILHFTEREKIAKIDIAENLSVALDSKAPISHATTSTAYGVGNSVDYGHVKVRNDLSQTAHENGVSLSAYQGKVLKDSLDNIADELAGKLGTEDTAYDSARLNGTLASGYVLLSSLTADYYTRQQTDATFAEISSVDAVVNQLDGKSFKVLTSAQYDALSTKSTNTIYFIT